MAGDMRVRLLLELVNRLSGPAQKAAADVRSVGAAAKAVQGAGTGKLQQDLQQTSAAAKGAGAALAATGAAARDAGRPVVQPLQQALAGVADQARRADDALDATAAAARDAGRPAVQPLQQALAGVADQARRADDALDATAAAARDAGRPAVQPLQQALAGVADQARRADDALDATAGAARRLDGPGPRELARVLAGIPSAGSRSAEAMAAIAREANRLASVGPGQALRRDLAQVAREARRSRDALAEAEARSQALARALNAAPGAAHRSAEALAAIAREAGRLERAGPGQALRRDLAQVAREARRTHDVLGELTRGVQRLDRRTTGQPLRRDLAQIAREARRADDALHGVTGKAQRLQQANIGSAMQRGLASITTEAERARKALAATNAEAGRAARQRPASVPSSPAGSPSLSPEGSSGNDGAASLVAFGKHALLMGGGVYAARKMVGGTVGNAIDFEAAFADVRKKVDLPEGREWSEIEREITAAAVKYGRRRGEVAALTANLGASGVKFEGLPAYIDLATKTGVSWDMTADSASGEMMKARAGLGWTLEQLQDYGDKVNALGDASNALERDIAEMFGRASGAAAAAGVSTDVTLAGLTALNSVGVQPEIASRFFAQFSAKLARASSDDPKKWAAAGLNNKAVSAGMRTDTFETMVKVLDQIASKANAAELAVEIFGEGWWDEAMRLQRAIPEWRRMMALLGDPANWKGSQQAALDVELSTTQNHLDRLYAASEKVGASLASWTLPPIASAADGIVKAITDLEGRSNFLMELIKDRQARWEAENPGKTPEQVEAEGLKEARQWENDLVRKWSGDTGDNRYIPEYLYDSLLPKMPDNAEEIRKAKIWQEGQQKLDAELEKLIAAEREARDKVARLQHERDQARKMGIGTGVLDYQIGRAETDLEGKAAAADAARADQRARRRKVADDAIEESRKFEIGQRRQLFQPTRDWGAIPGAGLTRNLPDPDRLKADGLPAVVGGFDTTASGVRAGYTEKPAPRAPTKGWRISKDEAGGYELPPQSQFPDFSQRQPAMLQVPESRPIILPQRPELPRFGFSGTGAAPQPEQHGAAGAPTPVGMRMIDLQEMLSPPDIGATIMDRLAADIEAGRPKVEGSAQAVGDSLRNILHGADLAPAGQAAMDSYAAGIAANGDRAVAAAKAVSARVQSALRVDMSGAVSGGSSLRGRIGGSLHDIPTGGP